MIVATALVPAGNHENATLGINDLSSTPEPHEQFAKMVNDKLASEAGLEIKILVFGDSDPKGAPTDAIDWLTRQNVADAASMFDVKPVSVWIPKGDEDLPALHYYIWRTYGYGHWTKEAKAAAIFNYTATPTLSAKVAGKAKAGFDIEQAVAVLPKDPEQTRAMRFFLKEVTASLNENGKLSLSGRHVDDTKGQAILDVIKGYGMSKAVMAGRPILEATTQPTAIAGNAVISFIPPPSPECMATESDWTLCVPQRPGEPTWNENLGGWYKNAKAGTEESLLEKWLAPRTP